MQEMIDMSNFSDEDLYFCSKDDLISLIRHLDNKLQQMNGSPSSIDTLNGQGNREWPRLQTQLSSYCCSGNSEECLNEVVASLRETSTHLHQDNCELRELCCFLDSERAHLAEEVDSWLQFAANTRHFMNDEMTSYQEKLQDLEIRQQSLLRENLLLRSSVQQSRVPTSPLRVEAGFQAAGSSGLVESGCDLRQLDAEGRREGDGKEITTPEEEKEDQRRNQHRIERALDRLQEERVALHAKYDHRTENLAHEDAQEGSGRQFSADNLPRRSHTLVRALKVMDIQDSLEDQPSPHESRLLQGLCNVAWCRLATVQEEEEDSETLHNRSFDVTPSKQRSREHRRPLDLNDTI